MKTPCESFFEAVEAGTVEVQEPSIYVREWSDFEAGEIAFILTQQDDNPFDEVELTFCFAKDFHTEAGIKFMDWITGVADTHKVNLLMQATGENPAVVDPIKLSSLKQRKFVLSIPHIMLARSPQ